MTVTMQNAENLALAEMREFLTASTTLSFADVEPREGVSALPYDAEEASEDD